MQSVIENKLPFVPLNKTHITYMHQPASRSWLGSALRVHRGSRDARARKLMFLLSTTRSPLFGILIAAAARICTVHACKRVVRQLTVRDVCSRCSQSFANCHTLGDEMLLPYLRLLAGRFLKGRKDSEIL
jgi:hypothetical protein